MAGSFGGHSFLIDCVGLCIIPADSSMSFEVCGDRLGNKGNSILVVVNTAKIRLVY